MTALAVPLCGLCAHRAHGEGPCSCKDYRLPCGCWPELMPYPGQREMYVARRMRALGRGGPTRAGGVIVTRLQVPRATVYTTDHRGQLVPVGQLPPGEVIMSRPERERDRRDVNAAGSTPPHDVSTYEDRQAQWWAAHDALMAQLQPIYEERHRARADLGNLVLLVLALGCLIALVVYVVVTGTP